MTDKKKKGSTVLRYMKKYFWQYVIGLGALIAVDFVQLRIPRITGNIIDGLQSGKMDMPLLWNQIVLLLLFGLLIALGRFTWRMYIFGTGRKVEMHLRQDFFIKLEKLSLSFFNQQKTGDLMAYATNDINAIRMMVGPGVLMALDALVLTIFVTVRMVTTISLRLTLISIIPLPIIAIGSLILGKFIRRRFKEKQEAFAHISDLVQENISGMRVIKAFVRESYEQVKFSVANRNNYNKNMNVVKLFAVIHPLVGLISGLSIAIALGVGGRMAMTGEISLGDFVAFIQYIMMLIWPMMAFGWCINIMSQGSASLTRYEEILSTPIDVEDSPITEKVENLKGNIEVKNLTFSYNEEDAPVLKDVSFNIMEGQTLGILGRTGSGKTTLANILLRLFNPPRGSVQIDGYDILDLPIKQVRQSFAYVPQDNFLFSDTIGNNIGFVMDEVDPVKTEEMAKAASVHHNIIEFNDGYDTVVGERGVTLSGGQKQRVSIARALMVKAPFLVFDDAVSAVDTKTEEAILRMLKEERGQQTTIMIAHRISTLQGADHIIVLDEGQVVEAGNHETLMELEGLYYDMTMRQQLEKEIGSEG